MRYDGRYKGQTKAEFNKNYSRIRDIISKAPGDEEKQTKLAQTQSNRITDEFKALNRAMAAKEYGHEHLFGVFFRRAHELGAVSKQDYRAYMLERLGI